MGLVLADALIQAGHEVAVWGPFEAVVRRLAETRENPGRMPGFHLREEALVCVDAAEAFEGAFMAVNAIPTQFIRPVWTRVGGAMPAGAPVVSVAKGIENKTLLRPSEVLTDVVPAMGAPCALSGPTIAAELAARQPAVLVAASDDAELAREVQQTFSVPWLRIYAGDDLLGVELAGACKNVIALAAGICDGLQLGDNAKSAVLARGLAEITRLGLAMGASAETFYGVAGVGDLATTCFSPHGRNRTCGEALGRGVTLDAYQADSDSVVEGVATSISIASLASQHRVDMPIAATVHAVLFEGLTPAEGVERLMRRASGAE